MIDPSQAARESQRIVNAFHRVFETAEGKLVMQDLQASFGTDRPAFIPLERTKGVEYDPIHAAIRDGQRQVILHINHRLKTTPKGDDDAKPNKVIK